MYQAIFGLVTNNRRNEQPGDLSASLLLTSEKAVFCNFINDIVTRGLVYVKVDCFLLFLLKILPILSSWPPSLTKSSLWWITWGTTSACHSSTQHLLFRLGFSARPGEFLPTNWMSDLLTKAACGNLTPLRPVCKNAVFLFVGYDEYFL